MCYSVSDNFVDHRKNLLLQFLSCRMFQQMVTDKVKSFRTFDAFCVRLLSKVLVINALTEKHQPGRFVWINIAHSVVQTRSTWEFFLTTLGLLLASGYTADPLWKNFVLVLVYVSGEASSRRTTNIGG